MPASYAWAVLVLAAYLLLCWHFLWRHRPRLADTKTSVKAKQVLVAYASQSGQAEQLARQHGEVLARQQPVVVAPLDRVDSDLLMNCTLALFIVSTYGEGESPDNGLRFQRKLQHQSAAEPLAHLRFAVLALGDRQYRYFCAFGLRLADGLARTGAQPLFDTVTVDRMQQEHLAIWQQQLAVQGLLADLQQARSTQPAFTNATVQEQVCINEGSPGAPVYRLVMVPAEKSLHWQAGDIVQIRCGSGDDAVLREYSIASLPEEGHIALLVRQVRKDDGSFGIGSAWLTRTLAPGDKLQLRIRHNPRFHAPAAERPMILIGNGTGMAGLRAHLKARELAGAQQNCLFFGERTRLHDRYYAEDLDAWSAAGHVLQLHLAFSRDQHSRLYVQHLLQQQAALLQQWVANGATIYVCGSLEGMAAGVDQTLQSILRANQLENMKTDGSYARDVY